MAMKTVASIPSYVDVKERLARNIVVSGGTISTEKEPWKSLPKWLWRLPCVNIDGGGKYHFIDIRNVKNTKRVQILLDDLELATNTEQAYEVMRMHAAGGFRFCLHELERGCSHGTQCNFVHPTGKDKVKEAAECVYCPGDCGDAKCNARHRLDVVRPPVWWNLWMGDDGEKEICVDFGTELISVPRKYLYATYGSRPSLKRGKWCSDTGCTSWFWCEKVHIAPEFLLHCEYSTALQSFLQKYVTPITWLAKSYENKKKKMKKGVPLASPSSLAPKGPWATTVAPKPKAEPEQAPAPDAVEKETAKLQKELQELKDMLAESEEKEKAAQNQVEALEAEKKKLTEALSREKVASEGVVQKMQAEHTRLRAQLEEAKANLLSMHRKFIEEQAKSEKYAMQASKSAEAKGELESLKAQLTSLLTDNQALKTQVVVLQASASSHEDELVQLKGELEKKEMALNAAQAMNDLVRRDMMKQAQANEEMQKRLEEQQDEINELKERVRDVPEAPTPGKYIKKVDPRNLLPRELYQTYQEVKTYYQILDKEVTEVSSLFGRPTQQLQQTSWKKQDWSYQDSAFQQTPNGSTPQYDEDGGW